MSGAMYQPESHQMSLEDIEAWRRRIREYTFGNYHLKMGQAFLQQGEIATAAAAFQRAIEADPQLVEAVMLLEDALSTLGQPEAAAAATAQLRHVTPNYRTLAVQRLAAEFIENGDYASARSLLDKALATGVAPDDVALEQGVIAVRQNDPVAAMPLLARGLACREAGSGIWMTGQMMLGRLLFEQRDYAEAVARFDSLPNLEDCPIEDAMRAAYSLLVVEQFERSASLMDRLILRHPRNIQPRLHAGFVAVALGRNEDAHRHFQAILQDQPGHFEALSGTMLAHVASGNPAAALDSDILARVGDYPHALACKGLALQRLGRSAEAVSLHRQACNAAPSMAVFHADLGMALEDSGDVEEARKAFGAAAGQGRNSLWLWFWIRCRPWAQERLAVRFQDLRVPRPGRP